MELFDGLTPFAVAELYGTLILLHITPLNTIESSYDFFSGDNKIKRVFTTEKSKSGICFLYYIKLKIAHRFTVLFVTKRVLHNLRATSIASDDYSLLI
jgi:hypothetical protein